MVARVAPTPTVQMACSSWGLLHDSERGTQAAARPELRGKLGFAFLPSPSAHRAAGAREPSARTDCCPFSTVRVRARCRQCANDRETQKQNRACNMSGGEEREGRQTEKRAQIERRGAALGIGVPVISDTCVNQLPCVPWQPGNVPANVWRGRHFRFHRRIFARP